MLCNGGATYDGNQEKTETGLETRKASTHNAQA